MKVLVPYYILDNFAINDKIIVGGTEMFMRRLYNNVNDVILLPITVKERKHRLVLKKIIDAIHEHDIDVVICNYDTSVMTTTLMKHVDIPIIWISHVVVEGISIMSNLDTMYNFMKMGGYLCMVSSSQYDRIKAAYRRIKGAEFPPITGKYINPSFCTGNETCYEPEYDVSTVGRIDSVKDPFFIHRKGKGVLHTKVFTTRVNDNTYVSKVGYEAKNTHWEFPQEIIYNLPHKEVMMNMAKAYVYNSTCTKETWGITCLEALSHGLPVLLNSNTGSHASEIIPAKPDHVKIISKQITNDDYVALVNKYKKEYTYDRRVEISELTKEKHTKEKWVNSMYDMIDSAISSHKKQKKSGLTEFFNA